MEQQVLTTKADELAKKHQEVNVAEFFAKNEQFLGFGNTRQALLTTIKEAVDNSLDACEEAEILPEIIVEIIDMGDERMRVIIEDNGPGIIKKQIPKIFAKLLYGSKFHARRQQRGQQGIGVSAAVMYAQKSTGRPAKITSTVGVGRPAHYYELHIDTKTNQPDIQKDETVDWPDKHHGTKIELDIKASYQKGAQSVDSYLKQTAITNPHATIIYTNPRAEQFIFARVSDKKPPISPESKPHPYGVSVGEFYGLATDTKSKTLQAFLTTEFSRVSTATAQEICRQSAILPNTKPQDLSRIQVDKIIKGIAKTKIMAPSTDCINPIGAELFEKGLRKEVNAEFYAAVTRPAAVQKGNPFVVEAALAYGGDQKSDSSATLFRFANRVPLQFEQGADATSSAVTSTNWRSYGLSQSQNSMPTGPITIAIHVASIWIPFTSQSKTAIAATPELLKEIRLALQDIGRQLARYVRKRKNLQAEHKKRGYIEKYIPHVADALKELLGLQKAEELDIKEKLEELLEHTRGKAESLEFDKDKNTDFDEEFANIGKEDDKEDREDDDEKEE